MTVSVHLFPRLSPHGSPSTWIYFLLRTLTQRLVRPCFSHLESTLTPEESDNCEGVISSAEAFEASNGMARNKSPGIDGLPAEFYLTFWNTLGEDLVSVLNHAFQSGHLSVRAAA